ncbi:hypothetical protein TNCV_1691781 [Trichonephila clavipes]|nr:hypothetical protein TNCV_1691781 [Trichonephila clavipes]
MTEKSVECLSNHPVANRDVRSTVLLLENSNTVRITEQHKQMELITQNFFKRDWYTQQRSKTIQRKNTSYHDLVQFQPGMQDPWLHEPDALFSALRRRSVVGIETPLHATRFLSSKLQSLCSLTQARRAARW